MWVSGCLLRAVSLLVGRRLLIGSYPKGVISFWLSWGHMDTLVPFCNWFFEPHFIIQGCCGEVFFLFVLIIALHDSLGMLLKFRHFCANLWNRGSPALPVGISEEVDSAPHWQPEGSIEPSVVVATARMCVFLLNSWGKS